MLDAVRFQPPPSFGDAFELRVTLRHIDPLIWRRLRVPVHLSLGSLHDILQAAFGWQNCHLHEFHVGHIRFAVSDVEDEGLCVDERAAALGAVARTGTTLVYHYDYGDDWEHDVVVENMIGGEHAIACTGGARACPPEDCGGPHGYMRLLEILANPKDEEHADMKTWVGKKFDAERFDLAAVNKKLATISKRLLRRRT